jgi:hypothetical protein
MSIILLRGFSNSGKDYVGKILSDKYEYKRFAFADSLKNIVAKQYNCNTEQLHSQAGKLDICLSDSAKRTYRQILIDEALRLRNLDCDIFAKLCCEDIKKSSNTKIVITDWRYLNELDVISKYFPDYKIQTVHIKRIGQNESPVSDISEYQLQNRINDYTIYNSLNDTIYNEIEKLINYIQSENT